MLNCFYEIGISWTSYGKSFHQAIASLVKKYGEIFSFNIFFRRIIVLSRIDHVEHVLSRRQIYDISKTTTGNFSLLFPNGLLALKGDEWKRHARILIPVFRRNKVLPYFEIIVECMDDFIDQKLIQNDKQIHKNLVEQCQIVLMRILGRIAFNYDFAKFSKDGEKLHHAFSDMIDCASQFAVMSTMPLWLTRLLVKFNWKFQRALKTTKHYVMIIVDDAIKRRNTQEDFHSSDQRKSFIDLLIESSINEKNSLTQDEIFDEIAIAILAGYETTSTALSWFIFYMSKYPHVQQKIKDELKEHGLTPDATLTYEMIEKLIYIDCVAKEIMRFAPIAAGILREATDNDILDGYEIRKGDLMLIAIQNLHQDSKYWNIDPTKFYPERFLDEDKCPLRYAYLPFGGGHRACMGQDLAMLELKTAITRFMQRVTIEDPGHEHNNSGGFVQYFTCFPKHMAVRITSDENK